LYWSPVVQRISVSAGSASDALQAPPAGQNIVSTQ